MFFSYLFKFGKIKKVILQGGAVFTELPQIPGVLIFYRNIEERSKDSDK